MFLSMNHPCHLCQVRRRRREANSAKFCQSSEFKYLKLDHPCQPADKYSHPDIVGVVAYLWRRDEELEMMARDDGEEGLNVGLEHSCCSLDLTSSGVSHDPSELENSFLV